MEGKSRGLKEMSPKCSGICGIRSLLGQRKLPRLSSRRSTKIRNFQWELWEKMHWRDFSSPQPVCPNRALSLDCLVNGYFTSLLQSLTKSRNPSVGWDFKAPPVPALPCQGHFPRPSAVPGVRPFHAGPRALNSSLIWDLGPAWLWPWRKAKEGEQINGIIRNYA